MRAGRGRRMGGGGGRGERCGRWKNVAGSRVTRARLAAPAGPVPPPPLPGPRPSVPESGRRNPGFFQALIDTRRVEPAGIVVPAGSATLTRAPACSHVFCTSFPSIVARRFATTTSDATSSATVPVRTLP